MFNASIMPLTSQNHAAIKENLHRLLGKPAEVWDNYTTLRCENRNCNYVPCIRSSAHSSQLRRGRLWSVVESATAE